jgi:hypothetical protein
MIDIAPIETIYRGYRFRSRLEARWAVFFQTLGVRWEYEPEGFRLSTGEWYLPDFRIKLADQVLWAEVKPDGADSELFEQFMADLVIIDPSARGTILHNIPDPEDGGEGDFDMWCRVDVEGDPVGCDCGHEFCICGDCGAVGFEYGGRDARIQCGCDKGGSDRWHNNDQPRILAAYAAARAARFEHGEQP